MAHAKYSASVIRPERFSAGADCLFGASPALRSLVRNRSFCLRVFAAPSAPLARHLPVSSSEPYPIGCWGAVLFGSTHSGAPLISVFYYTDLSPSLSTNFSGKGPSNWVNCPTQPKNSPLEPLFQRAVFSWNGPPQALWGGRSSPWVMPAPTPAGCSRGPFGGPPPRRSALRFQTGWPPPGSGRGPRRPSAGAPPAGSAAPGSSGR